MCFFHGFYHSSDDVIANTVRVLVLAHPTIHNIYVSLFTYTMRSTINSIDSYGTYMLDIIT